MVSIGSKVALLAAASGLANFFAPGAAGPSLGLMERRFKLRFSDTGEPVVNETIYMVADNARYRGETDADGNARIDFPGEFVERLEVGPHLVKKDWFIEHNDYLDDVFIDDPEKTEYDSGGTKEITGVTGRIFWHDGTSMDQDLRVEFELTNGMRFSSEKGGGYVRSDGSFFVPIIGKDDEYASASEWNGDIRFWFVAGDQVAHVNRVGKDFFLLVMHPRMGGGKSEKGGMITGRVIDENGSPVEGAKITAEVSAGGFFGFLSSAPEEPKAVSKREGRFALAFAGGSVLKKIYIDGEEPTRAFRKRKDDTEVPLPTREIRAGTFGVYFVSPDKSLFGRFFRGSS